MLRHDVDEALACTIKPFDFELYLRSAISLCGLSNINIRQ